MTTSNLISTTMELAPAYGRDYKSRADVIADFKSGKDFIGDWTIGFKPCGIADFAPGTIVLLRFWRNTKVASYKV